MKPEEFDSWLAEAVPVYAAEKVSSGQWREEDALDLSRKEHDQLLPNGIQSDGCHFFTIHAPDEQRVGMLWFAEKTKFGVAIAYVFNIEIKPEHRRHGPARRALQALEAEVAALNLRGVALHVFGHNAAARALYAGMGYKPTNINLFKHVPTDA